MMFADKFKDIVYCGGSYNTKVLKTDNDFLHLTNWVYSVYLI